MSLVRTLILGPVVLVAGCHSHSPAPVQLPDLVVKDFQVEQVQRAGGQGGATLYRFELKLTLRNKGVRLPATESFDVVAFLQPPGGSSASQRAVPVRFGSPFDAVAGQPEGALRVSGPIGKGKDLSLSSAAYAAVPWPGSQLEVVVVVDHCTSGPPCSVAEANESNNQLVRSVSWP